MKRRSLVQATKLIGEALEEVRAYGATLFEGGRESEIPAIADISGALSKVRSVLEKLEAGDPAPSLAVQPQGQKRKAHYSVDGDMLVKHGFGRGGSSYEHRVPRESYDGLVELVGGYGRAFQIKRLIKDSRLPEYQAYIAISVLVKAGLIEKVGRGNYRRISPKFQLEANHLWQRLDEGTVLNDQM